jgi:hypothetical protein
MNCDKNEDINASLLASVTTYYSAVPAVFEYYEAVPAIDANTKLPA